ncbi:MAG: hypothetical protein ACKVT2_23150 [Saprospiraceae bacterium]
MADNLLEELEPQQYQRLYFEEDVPVMDHRSGLLKGMFYASVGLFMLMLTIAALVRFPDQIELPFVLKGENQEAIYKFPNAVYVVETFVRAGDSVAAKSKIAKITAPELVQMIQSLNEIKAREDRFSSFGKLSAQQRQKILQASINKNLLRLQEQQDALQYLQKNWKGQEPKLALEWKNAREQLATYKQLYENGLASRLDIQERENAASRTQEALSTARNGFRLDSIQLLSGMDKIRMENAGLEQEMSLIVTNVDQEASGYQSSHELSRQQLQHTFGDYEVVEGAIILLAPFPGRITYLFEGEKELKSGSTLFKIAAGNEATYAFVKCPPGMAGKLRAEQDCQLKIASFPFYEWGAVAGKISELSLAPDESGQYNLRIQLSDPGRLRGRLFPGLTGSAVVILEEKTLLEYFFHKAGKYYHQFMEGDF